MARRPTRKPFALHTVLTHTEREFVVDVFSTTFSNDGSARQVQFVARCPIRTLQALTNSHNDAMRRVYSSLTSGQQVVDLHVGTVIKTVYTVTLPQGVR